MIKTTEKQLMKDYQDMIIKQCGDWKLDCKRSNELIEKCLTLEQFKKEIIKLIKEPSESLQQRNDKVTIGKYSYPMAYVDFVKRSRRYKEWMDECIKRKCGKCLIYVVEMFDGKEKFIKVGVTKTTIQKRFEEHPYKYRVLFCKLMNVTNAYIKEQITLYVFQDHKYTPTINFSGYTECITPKMTKDVVTFVKMSDKNINVKCKLPKRTGRNWKNKR